MYRHPSSYSPTLTSTVLNYFNIKLKADEDYEPLLINEKPISSYGSTSASKLFTKVNITKPVSSIIISEVTVPDDDESEEDNTIEVTTAQPVVIIEGGEEELCEEEVAKFPMSVLLSARRGYRRLQGKYIYDRFPLICAIIFFVEFVAMSKIISMFNASFEKRPITTMMVSNAILNAVADTVAQTVTAVREKAARRHRSTETLMEEGTDAVAMQIHQIDAKIPDTFARGELIPESKALPPPFDFERLSRFMAWGIIMAPIQFTWFKVLSRAFPIKDGAGMVPALKRMGTDQLCFSPLGLVGFFTFMTYAEGGNKDVLKRKFEQVYIPALRSNYLVWPAVQLINFRVMPIQFQLPFVSTVGIFWTTYLSLTNSAADVAED